MYIIQHHSNTTLSHSSHALIITTTLKMIDEVYDFSDFIDLEYHKLPVIRILSKRGTTHCLEEYFAFHLTNRNDTLQIQRVQYSDI